MTPLLACFPVFMTLVVIALMMAAMLVYGAMTGKLGESGGLREEARQVPWWFVVLAFVVPPIILILLSFVTAG
jgi:hypothetical protein